MLQDRPRWTTKSIRFVSPMSHAADQRPLALNRRRLAAKRWELDSPTVVGGPTLALQGVLSLKNLSLITALFCLWGRVHCVRRKVTGTPAPIDAALANFPLETRDFREKHASLGAF